MVRAKLHQASRVLLSVRMRAGLVVTLAVLPLIALLLARALVERNALLHAAEVRALDTAELLVERQDASRRELTTLLASVRRIPAVSALDAPRCSEELAIAVMGRADQLEMWATDASGHIACSSMPDSLGLDVGNAPPVRAVMAPDGPQRLQSFVPRGRVRDIPVIVSQMPLFGPGGERVGVLTATLPFAWLTDIALRLNRWSDSPIFLLDAQTGEVLARSLEPDAWVGHRFPDHPVLRAWRASPTAGIISAVNPRGVAQVFGYAPIEQVAGHAVLLVVALDRVWLLALAGHEMALAMMLAAALGLSSIGLAWWAAHASLVRPIRQLVHVARELGSRTEGTALSAWHPPELRLLGLRLRARSRSLASAQAATALSEANLRLLAESTSDVILRLDRAMRILYVSPAIAEVLACTAAAFAARRLRAVHPADLAQVTAQLAQLRRTGSGKVTARWRRGEHWVWLEARGRRAADGSFVCVLRDVTAQRAAHERIRHMAHHDGLTGLLNRTELRRQLRMAIERSTGDTATTCLLYIDLDGFKQVNDTLGHAAGDDVLREVAERLTRFLAAIGADGMDGAADGLRGTAARLGGDEFVLLLAGVPASVRLEGWLQLLLDALCEPVRVGSRLVPVGASIGVACHPRHGATAAELTSNADAALYVVKQRGRRGYALFDATLVDQRRQRQRLERELVQAIGTDQMRLVHQPVTDARSRRVLGTKALPAWQHPVLGPLPPAELAVLAQGCGQTGALALWALRQACAEAASWSAELSLAVSVPPGPAWCETLPEQVAQILAATGLPARRLHLEVSGAGLAGDETRAARVMRALQRQGVSVTLEDLGSGGTSLASLGGLGIDALKLDRALLRGLDTQPGQAVVAAILGLARALGAVVVAEGVEGVEQLDRLHDLGCTRFQGFLPVRPASAKGAATRAPERAAKPRLPLLAHGEG